MGKQLCKSNVSAKDLIAIQTYIREYCNSYYLKVWANRTDNKDKYNSTLCQIIIPKEPKSDLYLSQLLYNIRKEGYKFVEIEADVDANIGKLTVLKIENGIIKYHFPFIDYARFYQEIVI